MGGIQQYLLELFFRVTSRASPWRRVLFEWTPSWKENPSRIAFPLFGKFIAHKIVVEQVHLVALVSPAFFTALKMRSTCSRSIIESGFTFAVRADMNTIFFSPNWARSRGIVCVTRMARSAPLAAHIGF